MRQSVSLWAAARKPESSGRPTKGLVAASSAHCPSAAHAGGSWLVDSENEPETP